MYEKSAREVKKDIAIEFYDRGVPSALPDDNPFKRAVEQHRWGNRTDAHAIGCPICERGTGRTGQPVEIR